VIIGLLEEHESLHLHDIIARCDGYSEHTVRNNIFNLTEEGKLTRAGRAVYRVAPVRP
jgi:DeoR/GlpR family transcriptional regulator of sugar metabolism